MPSSIRLCLAPLPPVKATGLGGPPITITGLRLSFWPLGSGPSLGQKDVAQPAKISFAGRFTKSIRTESETLEADLGELTGQIRFQGPSHRVIFRCDPDSLTKLVQPEQDSGDTQAPAEEQRPRALDLELEAGFFEGLEALGDATPQLLLPAEASQYSYLQLFAELSIADGPEASRDQNDILDVPIWRDSPPPARAYEVRFIDEVGEPIDDVALLFAFDGLEFERTTGGGGHLARVLSSSASVANVTLVEPEALNPVLTEKWGNIRGKPNLPKDCGALNRHPKELEDGLEATTDQRLTVCVRPPVELGRLYGAVFESNKCFLLPTAVPSLRRLVDIYDANEVKNRASADDPEEPPKTELLIVGHTDTSADPDYNLTLSCERADALRAYLLDDVDAWLAWFGTDKTQKKRWGAAEELLMIESLVPIDDIEEKGPMLAYQQWHNDAEARGEKPEGWQELEPNGEMDSTVRKQLVIDYMDHDSTTLDASVRVVTYGCGETFPLATADGALDTAAEDGQKQQEDRRVEVFFFGKPFGIQPPVPGVAEGASPSQAVKAKKGDQLYLEWRARALALHPLEAGASRGFRLRLCNYDLEPYSLRPFVFCLEGQEQIHGTTDEDGFAIVGELPGNGNAYVEVWPDDDVAEDKVRWDITVGDTASPRTPQGASTRLANLDYYPGEPTEQMTDELRDAICYFQLDTEGLEVTGELNRDTAVKLREAHDCP